MSLHIELRLSSHRIFIPVKQPPELEAVDESHLPEAAEALQVELGRNEMTQLLGLLLKHVTLLAG